MNAAAKLSAHGVALVVVFGGTWAAGSALGPLGDGTTGAPNTDRDHRQSRGEHQ